MLFTWVFIWILFPLFFCLVKASFCFQASGKPCWPSLAITLPHTAALPAQPKWNQASQLWAAFLWESGLAAPHMCYISILDRQTTKVPSHRITTVPFLLARFCTSRGRDHVFVWFLAFVTPILSKVTGTENICSTKADWINTLEFQSWRKDHLLQRLSQVQRGKMAWLNLPSSFGRVRTKPSSVNKWFWNTCFLFSPLRSIMGSKEKQEHVSFSIRKLHCNPLSTRSSNYIAANPQRRFTEWINE